MSANGFCPNKGAVRSAPAFLRHSYPGARSLIDCIIERGTVDTGDEVWVDGIAARVVTIGLRREGEAGYDLIPGRRIQLVLDVEPESIDPLPRRFVTVFSRPSHKG